MAGNKYIGKMVGMEYFINDGTSVPLEAEWKTIGSMRTKSFSFEGDTADGTTDDSEGGIREMLRTYSTLTVSGDGVIKDGDEDDTFNYRSLERHAMKPKDTVGQPTGDQPKAWFRITFPSDTVFTVYMMVSNVGREAPYDDYVTYSFEATATVSEFGLIIEDPA